MNKLSSESKAKLRKSISGEDKHHKLQTRKLLGQ